MFSLHWAGNLPYPSLFQLFNLFMENHHTELQPRFHTAHEAGVLYFHFHFPTSSQQDFPSSSCSHTWPELQSGLQPFPRISLGRMLGLFAGKHSCRSSLGSAASLKDDIGSSWCLLWCKSPLWKAFWSCSTVKKNPTELGSLKQLNWHKWVEVIPSFSH